MKALSKHHVNIQEMEQEFQIIECAKKDIDAFKPLYNKYYSEIKASVENTLYAKYAIKNEDLTKDITASIFESALRNIHKYNVVKGTPFKSWLYRIMQNEIAEYIRNLTIREKHFKNIEYNLPKYDEIASLNTLSSSQERKLNYLMKYLHKLEIQDQQLIHYRFFQDYSYKQIAQIMGLTENSLRTRMTRLLKKIQAYVENKGA